MNMNIIARCLIATALIASSSLAQSQAAKEEKVATPERITNEFSAAKSAEDYTGQRLAFSVAVIATVRGSTNKVCLPAYAQLRGMSKSTATGVLVRLRADKITDKEFPTEKCPEAMKLSAKFTFLPLEQVLGMTLLIDSDDISTLPENRSGLSYGALVVPFKYHLGGSRDFKGSGSVGPYAGYKMESAKQGASVEIVGFIGLTSLPVQRVVDGKTTSEDLSGVSYGIGVIGRIRDNFQVGLVLGADRTGKGADYPDNGKPWIAVSIGYAFSN